MSASTVMRVILEDNDCRRLKFQDGFPGSVQEMVEEVKRQCELNCAFRLQFMDSLFGNEFMNLTSIDELQDRGTVKVIRIESSSSDSQCAATPFSSASSFTCQ